MDLHGVNVCTRSRMEITLLMKKKNTIIISEDGFVQKFEPCMKPLIHKGSSFKRDSPDDGWQVWASYNNENNASFDVFLGSFNVPQDPPSWDGGIVYLFTGLQNDNWIPGPNEPPTPPGFDIIQPVLQYGGDSEDGGGDYWAIASWYVTVDENVFYSDPMELDAGDVIFGNMTRINSTSWYISGLVSAKNINSYLTVSDARLVTEPWAYVTLEVYEIDDCAGDFPSSPIQFTSLALYDQGGKNQVIPKWDPLNNEADHCGATVTVKGPSTVIIDF